MKRLSCVFSLVVLFATPSYAAVVDWGETSYDQSTGLEWLDLSFTWNKSYNTVTGQLDTLYGGGWQVASSTQVSTLWTNITGIDVESWNLGNDPRYTGATTAVGALLGHTNYSIFHDDISARISDIYDPGSHYVARLHNDSALIKTEWAYDTDEEFFPRAGTYLVRPARPVQFLNFGEAQTGFVAQGEWDYYRVETTAPDALLQISLTNLSGDVDLYASKSNMPSENQYDCRPYEDGLTDETCYLTQASGSWIIGVRGYTSGSYTLTAIFEGPTVLNSGEAHIDSVGLDEWDHFVIDATNDATELVVTLSDLSSDLDLYVSDDTTPSFNRFDCRPYIDGTETETCRLTTRYNNRWYISIHGYTAGSYSIEASLNQPTVLTDSEAVSGTVEQGQWQYFVYHVTDAGSELVVDLFDLTGDVDLYVMTESKPTLSSYSCRPYNGGFEAESCKVRIGEGGTVYIGVYGYNAGGFSVRAAFGGVPLLYSHQVKSDFVAQGQWHYYKFNSYFSDSEAELIIDLFNLNGDVDLYVQKGAKPTLTSYDCRPYVGGLQTESCSFRQAKGKGDAWYIGVYGYNAGDYSIVSKLLRLTELTSGQTESGTVVQGAWKHYVIEASADMTQLIVEMVGVGLFTDVDLYVRNGTIPTLEEYDCRPYLDGTTATTEVCTMANTGATQWYISVHGYELGIYNIKAILQ